MAGRFSIWTRSKRKAISGSASTLPSQRETTPDIPARLVFLQLAHRPKLAVCAKPVRTCRARTKKRRGEATSVFLDDEPSYHHFPAVLYYLGRAQEGLQSAGAASSYRAFLAIKTKASDDPLVADATKRLAGSK